MSTVIFWTIAASVFFYIFYLFGKYSGDIGTDDVVHYEHEHVLLVTPKERRFRAGCAMLVIFCIANGIVLFHSPERSLIKTIALSSALICLWYMFALKDVLRHNGKIKLTITSHDVLIRVLLRAPNLTFQKSRSRCNVTVPIHTIADVSVKSVRDLRINGHFLNERGAFQNFWCNTRVSFFAESLYSYLFVLHTTPLPNGKFICIGRKNGEHILIEFDEAENFIAVLKQSRYFQNETPDPFATLDCIDAAAMAAVLYPAASAAEAIPTPQAAKIPGKKLSGYDKRKIPKTEKKLQRR